MGGASSTHGREEEWIQCFGGENQTMTTREKKRAG
jgi:hypothetical protein